MKKIKKLNDPLREKQVVYIYCTFWDDYRTYKELRMVASHSLVTEINKICEKQKNDKNYVNSVYKETIYLAFRPRVLLQELCNSVIKYICCSTNIKNLILKYPETGIEICPHLNVVNNDLSEVRILPPELFAKISNIDPEYNLVENSELSMTLPSKITFLSELEIKFLDELFKKINVSNKKMVEMTFSELWDLIFEDSDEEDPSTKYELYSILDNLVFNDFITEEYLEEKDVYRLSINDFTHYYDFLQQSDTQMSS